MSEELTVQESSPRPVQESQPRPEKAPLLATDRGVQLSSMEDMYRFALCVCKSQLAPKGFTTPEAVIVAVQMGLEVGLSPMSALQNVCVINGRPVLYGDAALAIVRASGLLEEFSESIEGEGDKMVAACSVTRKGYPGHTTRFSVEDAKRAKLWVKAGPWTEYPKRMLQMRARGFELRDQFPDLLKGFKTVEEVQDYAEKPAKGRVLAEDEPEAKL